VLLVLSLLATVTVGSDPDGRASGWYSAEGALAGAAARVAPASVEPFAVTLELRVPGFGYGILETRGGPRSHVTVPGAGVTNELGRPLLPALRFVVEAPPGARLVLDLVPASVERVRLSEIGLEPRFVPVQPPVPKIEGAESAIPFVEDPRVYTSAAPWPAESAVVAGRGVLRGRHVALIEVRPVRYDPVAGSLELWSRAELRVTFAGGAPAAARRAQGRLTLPHLDGWIEERIVASPASVAGEAPPLASGAGTGAVGMLVVAHDDFAGALQPLLDWKEKTGFKVELLRTSDVGPSPTDVQVKAEIQERYHGWSDPPLGFVLLVGDTDFCPIHTGSGGGGSQVTDNWYACLDGPDYLPDVAVARISTRTPGETADVVNKLLTYERATFGATEWIKTAGFIGTNDSGHIGLIEGTHDWCIDTYYTPSGYLPTPWSHGGESCDRHYHTYGASTADIAASIDAGRSIVNYSGHGSTTSWEGPTAYGSYDQADVLANTNDGMYPFVISNACITGTLELPECFGETWQRASRRGAVAFWGASNNSYWDEDDVLQRALHERIFPMDDTPPIGLLVNQAKLDLYTHYGDVGAVAYYFDMYNLLAEPSLSLWTRVPRGWNVAHPAVHPLGESAFPVTVTYFGQPVAGALVAVRKLEDGVLEAGYTDAAGQVTLLLAPAPASPGAMEVTATGHDFLPYEGSAEVISPGEPWLVHRAHAVDDSVGGDGDGQANPGEEFVLSVSVQNVGQQPGTGLVATLSTSTPQWCEILDGAAAFPDLDPQEEGTTLADHFRVRVSDLAPNGVALGFDLAWSAAAGSSGVTSFNEPVRAVAFGLVSFAVDDAAQGNGNGVAGPGETVTMTLTLENTGHRDASGITAVLGTDSPWIEILQASVDFPDLPAAAAAGSLPPPLAFAVAEQAPDQQPVAFTLTIEETGSGHQEVLLFEVPISSCATTMSQDVPKPITDNATVESEIDYALPLVIGEVNVFVDISHTYQGDLRVVLVSPAGTSVVLHDRSGGSADDIETWYDTETAPTEPLSLLNGEGALGTWVLIVEDHAGGDTGALEGWGLEICGEAAPSPALLTVTGHEVDDAAACDPDGRADVGETVIWRVGVRNEGAVVVTGIRASLATEALVAVQVGTADLPDLASGAEAVASFEVLVGAVECLAPALFTVQLLANEGSWSYGLVATLEADGRTDVWVETLEQAGEEPAGWTHAAAQGVDDWRVVDDRNHTPLGAWSWFASDVGVVKDDRLVSPPYLLAGGNPTLSFYHWVELADGFDGGVLELSVDDGQSWSDLGPAVTTGGYDRTLGGTNPIAGRAAWSGAHPQWRLVVVDLTPWVGETVRLRFRLTSAAFVVSTGWWIDDLVLEEHYETCDAHPCGVPGEAWLATVAKEGGDVVLSWPGDPVCVAFRVFRAAAPSTAEAFQDVTAEDPDPTDTVFRDTSSGDLAYWIVVGSGPDGDGPWGHFGR
jgi:subtilisin-like proprotein convertase family protein